MTDDLPSYWAIEEMNKRIGATGHLALSVKEPYADCLYTRAIIEGARLLAKYEQPPVDPLLLEAREIVAKFYEEVSLPGGAVAVRAGKRDDEPYVKLALAALRRGKELAS